MRLTMETIEDVIDAVVSGERTLDLSAVRSIDVYALLVLDLVVRQARESGAPLSVAWPESPPLRRWMTDMRFFADLKTGLAAQPATGVSTPRIRGRSPVDASRNVAGALAPIASIQREGDVSGLVGTFDHRLAARYPIDEAPRRAFLRILFELFQNIPQHANATGDVLDPHGIAALQEDEDSVLLAIADKGIGLARSLGLGKEAGRPRASGRVRDARREEGTHSDADALRAVVFDGRSRFRDPGRGHELERVFRRVRSWEGTMVVRSGTALLFQSDAGGDVVDVAPFPGVQIALSIPRFALGLGEGPSAADGVESHGDPGFNEGNEEEDD